MTESFLINQTHEALLIQYSIYTFKPVTMFVYVSAKCLSICLSVKCLPTCLSVKCLSVCLAVKYLSVKCVSVYLSVNYVSVYRVSQKKLCSRGISN